MQNRPDNRPDFFVLPVCSGELLITGKTKSMPVIRLLPVLQITFQQTDNYRFFFFRPA
ncbi:hypothetical protein CSB69_3532 [Morganella morganii]|nr:hypothetical protein CSB69_3532 [Morganella morganii]EMP52677.1 hypothetical protein C790_03650 [Morganella morganii SC01]ETO43262.1 hypothetical protein X965_16420 [Morganella sp. EGD-HP17]